MVVVVSGGVFGPRRGSGFVGRGEGGRCRWGWGGGGGGEEKEQEVMRESIERVSRASIGEERDSQGFLSTPI